MSETILPLIEDPSLAGQSHWTAVKLHGWIKDSLQTQLGYSTTVRYLHEHDCRLKVPRPWPLNQDEDKRQPFCEKLQNWVADPSVDLWFSDESGFEPGLCNGVVEGWWTCLDLTEDRVHPGALFAR